MIKVVKNITINGVEVTMLFTPRLFVMAQQKGIAIQIESENFMHVMSAYADICYAAALNHWTMDNDIEDFPLTRADFHEWSTVDRKEFGRTMAQASEALSGKTLKEIIEEKEALEADKAVKKKSKSNVITRLLKIFS